MIPEIGVIVLQPYDEWDLTVDLIPLTVRFCSTEVILALATGYPFSCFKLLYAYLCTLIRQEYDRHGN